MPRDDAENALWSRLESEPSAILVTVPGSLRLADVDEFCDGVRAHLERTGAARALVDASSITKPGIAAFEALARVRLVARRLGRDCVICAPTPQLTGMLTLLGLDSVFDIDA
jgi:anti-anti-sigma regulatory factor